LKQKAASWIVAGYLLLCIVLGGSSQSAWPILPLQLLGIALIAWAAIHARTDEDDVRPVVPYLLLLFGLLVVLIQLVPLPATVWSSLPGRADIAKSIQELGFPLQPAPISEAPYESVLTLFLAIPAIAAFVATDRLSPTPRSIGLAIVTGMLLGILLGALQVAGGSDNRAYFYAIHSSGASGFFANHNHMATLLLVGIPMSAALIASAKPDRKKSSLGGYGLAIALLVVMLIGIILTGSRAAIALSVPVVLASATLFPPIARWRPVVLGVTAVTLVAAITFVALNPIASNNPNVKSSNVASRVEVWGTSSSAIRDSFPFGTGLGTFERVYHRYENPEDVTQSYINHAHNEYVELVFELGVGGLLLVVGALLWWMVAAVRIWGSSLSTPFARAATIATAAILAHDFVDFPIRTGAISAIFGACIALMAQHLRPTAAAKPGELRPTRHVKIG
jgi:O-antigen ligase